MSKIVNLSGRKVANVLTVLRLSENQIKGKSARWVCLCEICGKESDHSASKLIHRAHLIRSCGCLNYRLKGKRKSCSPDSVSQMRKTIKESKAVPKKMNVKAMKQDLQESMAVPVEKDTSPQIYRKKRALTPWEIGEREARACGAGRFNYNI